MTDPREIGRAAPMAGSITRCYVAACILWLLSPGTAQAGEVVLRRARLKGDRNDFEREVLKVHEFRTQEQKDRILNRLLKDFAGDDAVEITDLQGEAIVVYRLHNKRLAEQKAHAIVTLRERYLFGKKIGDFELREEKMVFDVGNEKDDSVSVTFDFGSTREARSVEVVIKARLSGKEPDPSQWEAALRLGKWESRTLLGRGVLWEGTGRTTSVLWRSGRGEVVRLSGSLHEANPVLLTYLAKLEPREGAGGAPPSKKAK